MSMYKCTVRMKLPAFRKALPDSHGLEACTDNRHKTLKRFHESFAARVQVTNQTRGSNSTSLEESVGTTVLSTKSPVTNPAVPSEREEYLLLILNLLDVLFL